MLYNGDTDLRLNVFSQTSIILQIYHLQHLPTNLPPTTSSYKFTTYNIFLQIYHLQHHPQIFIRRVHETQVNHAKS